MDEDSLEEALRHLLPGKILRTEDGQACARHSATNDVLNPVISVLSLASGPIQDFEPARHLLPVALDACMRTYLARFQHNVIYRLTRSRLVRVYDSLSREALP